ncbi:LysE family translocator [Parashewanella curva]|uniref:LysE family translocator n=1 Tax=Parashewanella curva TaxID=2338552 RepID=A0A3L8Q0G9_9GAMM|nr:LysE family translocator [Parashewanella curva]RLV60920.1 LysE family translocator [Parashewanella curva]
MLESWITLVLTTAAFLGSPGPAPLALAAVGASSGFKRGLPFLAGILSGIAVAITIAAVGLAALFETFPKVRIVCQLIATGYILFVAYKIATAKGGVGQRDEAPDFKDGFLLNLFNPKVYAAFLALFSQFLLPVDNVVLSYVLTGLTGFVVACIVDVIWLGAGGLLKPVFATPKRARFIRIVFAVLLVVSVAAALLL